MPRDRFPAKLKDRDVVIGRVSKIQKGCVVVDIYCTKTNNRNVTGETKARLNCTNCDIILRRKIAGDYGEWSI